MNWISRQKGNIALVVVSLILTVLALEGALHFTKYRSLITKTDYPRYYFTADPEIGFDITPNFATSTHYFSDGSHQVTSNSLGCFDSEYASETPYIYMAGDSLTWGFTALRDTWGTKVQDVLGMRTVKCGVTGGYGTKQELVKATRLLSRLPQPALITVGYTQSNDIDDDAAFPGTTIYKGFLVPNLAKGAVTETQAQEKYALFDKYCVLEQPLHPLLQRARCLLSNHSVLYNIVRKNGREIFVSLIPESVLLKSGLIAPMKATPDMKSEAEYQKHLANILGFRDLARKEGAKLLFVLEYGENERLKPFLEREGIPYVDLRPIFDRYAKIQPLRWPTDGHWNIAGNKLVGLVVSRFALEHDLVHVPDSSERVKAIDAEIEREFSKKK